MPTCGCRTALEPKYDTHDPTQAACVNADKSEMDVGSCIAAFDAGCKWTGAPGADQVACDTEVSDNGGFQEPTVSCGCKWTLYPESTDGSMCDGNQNPEMNDPTNCGANPECNWGANPGTDQTACDA